MNDILLVEVGESTEELLHDIDDERLWKMAHLFDEFDDGAALAVLHDHVVEGLEVVDFVEFDDVGMVELGKQAKLC